jgi:GMP synthase-like glutamine amidotransferase
VKVLAVQNIECETLGSFEPLLRSDGYSVDIFDAPKESLPADLSGYSGIIILGGPMSVYENYPYLLREQELIKSAIKSGVPVLGICLGSQLIAQATGGKVYRGKRKEIGWGAIELTRDGLADIFSGLNGSGPTRVFQWHGDTYELPGNARVLAANELYPQAFRVGSAVGIQFHLEVNSDMIRTWAEQYNAELEAEGIDSSSLLASDLEIEVLRNSCSMVYRNFAAAMKSRA